MSDTMVQKFLHRYMEQEKISKSELTRRLGMQYFTVGNLLTGQSGRTIDDLNRAFKKIGYRIVITRCKDDEARR